MCANFLNRPPARTQGGQTEWSQLMRGMSVGRYEFADVIFPPVPHTDLVVPLRQFTARRPLRFMEVSPTEKYVGGGGPYDGVLTAHAHGDVIFTGSGSLTWTVEVGDWQAYYTVVRDSRDPTKGLLWWNVIITTASTGGTASTELRLTLPAGMQVNKQAFAPVTFANENGTIGTAAIQALDSGTYVSILKTNGANWNNALTNTLSIYFTTTLAVKNIPYPDTMTAKVYQSNTPDTLEGENSLTLKCDVPLYSTRLMIWEERV